MAAQMLPGRYRNLRYHDIYLLFSQLEHKFLREAINIALDLFAQSYWLHPVQFRKVSVQHHLSIPDTIDFTYYYLVRYN